MAGLRRLPPASVLRASSWVSAPAAHATVHACSRGIRCKLPMLLTARRVAGAGAARNAGRAMLAGGRL